MRQAEIMRIFNNQDEKSVDFSEDPDMYKKLDMKKPRRGEEKPFELEKIYRFQLERDIEKIKRVRGSFKHRNNLYTELRHRDPSYRKVAVPVEIGFDGNFNELLPHTKEESWKATSKPYGEIAHKRYLEYLANLPKGPTEEEIKDKQQRKTDRDLWRKVLTGDLEPTFKEIKKAERERIRQLKLEEEENQRIDVFFERQKRKEAIDNAEFHLLRKLPTKREFNHSKKKWSKGIHYPYNIEKGFPIVMAGKKDQLQPTSSLEKPHVPRTFSSDVYLNGYYDGEKQYGDYLAELNFKKAEKYIQNHYYQIEKERRRKEKQIEIEKMNRRRQGNVSGANILSDVAAAKYLATKEKLAYTVKMDDEEDGGKNKSGKSYEVSIGRKKQKKVIEFEKIENLIGGEMKKYSKKKSVYDKDSDEDEQEDEMEAAEEEGSSSSSSSDSSDSDEDEEEENEEGEEEKEDLDDNQQLGRFTLQVDSPTKPKGLSDRKVPSLLNLNLFRSPSSIFPLETLSSSSSPSNRKKSSSKKKKRSATLEILLNPRKIEWDDVLKFYRDQKKAFVKSSFYQFFSREWHLTEPYKTSTAVFKEQALRDIERLGAIISNSKFMEERLELSPTELTIEEFQQLTKKKKRELRDRMKELTKKNPTKEEQHELLKYQRRYELLEEMIEERQRRYRQAEELINLVKVVLEKRYTEVEQLEETTWEKYQKYLINRFFYSPIKFKAMPKKLENLLPDPLDIEKQNELVEALLRHRFAERKRTMEQRRMWYRLVRFGGNIDDLDDKMDRQRRNHTADDLLLAAQSGDYRHVIDILDLRDSLADKFEPGLVKVNDISSDGLTATYSCLAMILNKEVLDTDANLDDLLLTNWQRRKKRFLNMFSSRKNALLNAARFDYVLQILLYYGGNLNFPRVEFGKDGLTIMHLACQQGAIEIIQWLLKKGVDINQLSTMQYRTPLMFAVERDQLETMLLLLREGAILGVHHVDNLGNNVLHYAAQFARPLITQILLICGVKSNVRNKKGFLPSEEAKIAGRMEVSTTILTFKDDIIDHLQRIDFLVGRIDVPFDYHTGKGYNIDPLSNPPLPAVAVAAPEEFFIEDDGTGRRGSRIGAADERHEKDEDEDDNEEETDAFPVVSPSFSSFAVNAISSRTEDSANSDETSPSTKRINKIWQAIQRPLRTAYSSPDMTVKEHMQKVKEDHSKSAPNIQPRIDVPLSALDRVSSVIGATLAGDGKTRKQKAAMTNPEEIVVAPRLRKTMLQLNFSRKAKN